MKNSIFVLPLALTVSCASITGSSTDRMRVMASPPGATVQVDDESRGTAPMTVEVSKHGRSSVEVMAPGYQPASCDTRMSPSGGYIAADVALCVFLFPLGCISFIDAGGAWNQLDQPQCHVSLVPEADRATQPGAAPKAPPPVSPFTSPGS